MEDPLSLVFDDSLGFRLDPYASPMPVPMLNTPNLFNAGCYFPLMNTPTLNFNNRIEESQQTPSSSLGSYSSSSSFSYFPQVVPDSSSSSNNNNNNNNSYGANVYHQQRQQQQPTPLAENRIIEEFEEDSGFAQDHTDSSSSSSYSPTHFSDNQVHYNSDDGSDDDALEAMSSSSLKVRAKPRGRAAATLGNNVDKKSPPLGRTSHGNPKRERRLRRPPFGEFCGECHIPVSTEWRKGPSADHLLCNACGLRYTRKVKKEQKGKK